MIQDFAKRIKKLEKKKEKLSSSLLEKSTQICNDSDLLIENNIIKEFKPEKFDSAEVIGLDGGIVKEELLGADIVLTRAVAPYFKFKNGKLASSSYIPNRSPKPEPFIIEGLSRQGFQKASSLLRVEKELSLAEKALDEEPDILLLDGSIVPHYRDKPSKSSENFERYERVLETLNKLYKKSKDKKVLLAGVIEDSRNSQICKDFAKHLEDEKSTEMLNKIRDLDLIDKVMEKNSRTSLMKYSEKKEKHPVLRDLESGKDIFSFYLKTAEKDLPVKIDFLSFGRPEREVEKIKNLIVPISSFNKRYGIPSVIIEADQRAKLSKNNLKAFKKDLRTEVGNLNYFKDLRRNRRPF